jgi:hypothetical protein
MLLKKIWVLVFGFYVFGFSRCKGKINRDKYINVSQLQNQNPTDGSLFKNLGLLIAKLIAYESKGSFFN